MASSVASNLIHLLLDIASPSVATSKSLVDRIFIVMEIAVKWVISICMVQREITCNKIVYLVPYIVSRDTYKGHFANEKTSEVASQTCLKSSYS